MRMLIFVGVVVLVAAVGPGENAVGQANDDAAIKELIARRQAAWNAGDAEAYRRLLTPDADILSSTGRTAQGRDAVIGLYLEQRAGAFAGAKTAVRVVNIRMIRPDVAIVDAEVNLDGLKTDVLAGQSRTTFVVVKQPDGKWLITAQRAGPQRR
jgi:uncharacterized protein (TIGR02246 family)